MRVWCFADPDADGRIVSLNLEQARNTAGTDGFSFQRDLSFSES
jgi:hypothetical protein